jgi:hypothetical protein
VTDQALARADELRARGELRAAAVLLDATARADRARAIVPPSDGGRVGARGAGMLRVSTLPLGRLRSRCNKGGL